MSDLFEAPDRPLNPCSELGQLLHGIHSNFTQTYLGVIGIRHFLCDVGSDWMKTDKIAGHLSSKLCTICDGVKIAINLWYFHKC